MFARTGYFCSAAPLHQLESRIFPLRQSESRIYPLPVAYPGGGQRGQLPPPSAPKGPEGGGKPDPK